MNIPKIPENITHVKLDIGLSYCAPYANIWLSKEPNLFVFGFEPDPESIYRILNDDETDFKNHFKKEHHNRICLNEIALSDVEKEETMPFYISEFDCGTSSLFKNPETILGKIKKTIDVKVFSLKMFFDMFFERYEYRFKYIDYIKIDAQGSDLKILKGAGDYIKNNVVYITAEPDGAYYIGCEDCNVNELDKFMIENQGFIKVNHKNTQDPTYFNPRFPHLKDIYISQGC